MHSVCTSLFYVLFITLGYQSTAYAKPSPADALARNYIFNHPAQSLVWDWRGSIFTYGLMEYARSLPPGARKNEFSQYVINYHTSWAKKGIPVIDRSDDCPSALSLLMLKKMGISPLSSLALEKVATYIRTQKRNDIGALDHLGALNVYPHSIWVDSLMMYALFAVQYGVENNEPALRDFGASQISIFAKALQDPTDHLFRHARYQHDFSYYNQMEHDHERPEVLKAVYQDNGNVLPKEAAYWLRGNSWVLVSSVEMLDVLPKDHPERQNILRVVREMTAALLKYQQPSGLWRTLINVASVNKNPSYEESSGTALVAYAIAHAVHRHYLPHSYLQSSMKAYQGLLTKLKPTPQGLSLTQNSTSTEPYPARVYTQVELEDDATYGVGGFLMLAAELHGTLIQNIKSLFLNYL